MTLTDAVEAATNLAAFKGEDHVVGRIKNRQDDWQIAHCEDQVGQQNMIDPKLVVHSNGLDKKYIEKGMVIAKLALPS